MPSRTVSPPAGQPRIYTRKGDDGTTGLLYGGRAAKSSPRIELNGVVDEAQAALGLARAETEHGSPLDELLIGIERDLYALMAEVATLPANRHKLGAGTTSVTGEMVARLEGEIDRLLVLFDMPSAFVIPGQNRTAAALDLARTVVRRAERLVSAVGDLDGDDTGGSQVGPYLNRLSDLIWAMARWQEGDEHLAARRGGRRRPAAGPGAGAGGGDRPPAGDGTATTGSVTETAEEDG